MQHLIAKDYYLQAFDKAQTTLFTSDTPLQQQQRQSALADFVKQGFPAPKNEQWKYTRIDPIIAQAFNLSTINNTKLSLDTIAKHCLLGSYRLVFVDGHFSEDLSDTKGLVKGVTCSSLSKQNYSVSQQNYSHGFTALNRAFMHDGALITLEEDVQLDKPLQLLFIASGEQQDWITHPRIMIHLAKNANMTLFEHYTSLKQHSYFTNCVCDIQLAEQASLQHYRLQLESQQAFHLGSTTLQQQANSLFSAFSMSLGGVLARHEIDCQLQGEQAHTQLNGIFFAHNKQHIDEHILIDHAQPQASSNVDYRGIIDNKGRGVFNGKILVRKDAQKTAAELSNKNLLLSSQAEIDTKPELEIFADDVKCSHGATVGQLDHDALFYLRARGIDEDLARNLLIYAFANDFIHRITEPALASMWHDIFIQQLGIRTEAL